MEQGQLLRDPNIKPTDDVLANALGGSYGNYKKFLEILAGSGIDNEWRYYNDSKSWLGKATRKGKTVFWLSVWDGFFKASFFFTEKTKGGLLELNIDSEIKSAFVNAKSVGKLLPLIFEIRTDDQLQDLFSVIEYKKSIK
jgi:hypothetical protein